MMLIRRCGFGFAVVCAGAVFAVEISAGLRAAQDGAATATLIIAGEVGTPLSIAPAELKSWPRARVEVKEDGRVIIYEGVLVGEILKTAGVPLGQQLRGTAVASYVLASATDGYQVVFSIGELDPALTGNDIIVADTVDGQPLSPYQGPLRIVAPKDLRGVRSIRMLQRLEVVRVRK
jgi:hypothetical protein